MAAQDTMTASPIRITGKAPMLIFMHIPKTAGITLERILRAKYLGPWPFSGDTLLSRTNYPAFLFADPSLPLDKRLPLIDALPPNVHEKVKLFVGQDAYGTHEHIHRDAKYITVFRDPIERVVSHFFHTQTDPLDPDYVFMSVKSLHDIMKDGDMLSFDNGQVRYMLGKDGYLNDTPYGQCTREMLEEAKRRLDSDLFLLAGLQERFDESLILLKRRLGWKECHYARFNVSKTRKRQDEMPPEAIEAVKEYNQLDMEFYAYAQQRFQDAIDAEGPSFQDEVAAFKESNAAFNAKTRPFHDLVSNDLRVWVSRWFKRKI